MGCTRTTELGGCLKVENLMRWRRIFHFFWAFVKRVNGEERDYPVTGAQTTCFELERWLIPKDIKEIVSDGVLGYVRVVVQKFKAMVQEKFDAHCRTGLYTLKSHFPDHVVEDLNLFGS